MAQPDLLVDAARKLLDDLMFGASDRVRAVAEENVYRVLLVHRDHRVIEGFHVYRGEQLPERGQFITVETALSPVPLQSPGPVQSRRARVNRVTPNEKFPIHAEELKP